MKRGAWSSLILCVAGLWLGMVSGCETVIPGQDPGGGAGSAGSGGSGGTGGTGGSGAIDGSAGAGGSSTDGGVADGGTGGSGGSTAPVTVARAANHWILDASGQLVGTTLPINAPLEALVESSGGFVSYPASGTIDGTFTIANVTPGTSYYLKDRGDYVVTSARTVDLGRDILGRGDVVRTTNPNTALSLYLTGLSPWQSADDLQVYSANAGAWSTLAAGPYPYSGSSVLLGFTLPWTRVAFPPALIDAGRGDRAVVTQLATRSTTSGLSYQALAKAFPVGFTLSDGQATTLFGSFTDVPQTQSIQLGTWQRSAFDALRVFVSPGARTAGQQILVDALPGGLERGWFGNTTDLVSVWTTGTSNVSVGRLGYGNPFPANWSTIGSVAAFYTVTYTLPGAVRSADYHPVVVYAADATTFASSSLAPLVGPVQNPVVDGASAFVARTSTTTTPLLSWGPPTVGAANGYVVFVNELTVTNGTTQHQLRARLFTTRASVRIPPGVLQAGASYFFVIRSLTAPGVDLEQHPYRTRLPAGIAETATAILTF